MSLEILAAESALSARADEALMDLYFQNTWKPECNQPRNMRARSSGQQFSFDQERNHPRAEQLL